MPYIGKTPTVGNFQVCDAISVVNGQAAYTLQVGGVNVAPESANHMLVSLNGILQKPGSSFTISGSTMTFASNLATGDVIDFVQILGNVLDLGTPSDDTVTAAKLNNNIISGLTALTSAPDATDELLISDAGTIKRIDASLVGRGKLLQVVSAVADVELAKTGSTYEDIPEMTASITPSSSSNKVLVLVQIANASKTGGDSQLDLRLLRDSTAVHLIGGLNDGSSTAQTSLGGIMIFLDSPSSTSSLTYKVQLSNRDGNGTVTVQGNNKDGSITLMEIAG